MSIRRNRNGRGVYADRAYSRGETVERAQVILVPFREIRETDTLIYYVSLWRDRCYAVMLGNGMLYNHSDTPNMTFGPDRKIMRYRALRNIRKGEELTIDYEAGGEFLPSKKARYARGD